MLSVVVIGMVVELMVMMLVVMIHTYIHKNFILVPKRLFREYRKKEKKKKYIYIYILNDNILKVR